ncbi:MAG: hypothetical protein K6C13_02065, partial [Oscillospiraceae bacterium]|nr:hypothetical protein [Oscillospiraceae bacterium]
DSGTANINIDSREFDEEGFASLLSKMGDGCRLCCDNMTVRSGCPGGKLLIGPCTDGCSISFDNCTLTSFAVSMIMSKLGDGCNVSFDNVTVTREGIEDMLEVGQASDGLNIALDNVTIPKKVLDLIHAKMGVGFNISIDNCDVE